MNNYVISNKAKCLSQTYRYALKFRTLAVASGWDERALITTYRQGLNPALRLHLAIYDDVMGVEKFIQQSIRVSRRVQNCYPDRHQSSYAFLSRPAENPDIRGVEPMQVDQTRLSPSERTRRMPIISVCIVETTPITSLSALFVHLVSW